MPDQATRSIIVQGRAEDLFRLWADVESFPRFMRHIRSVTRSGPRHTHWVMQGALGKDIEWDADITRFEEGKRLAWSSGPGQPIVTSGQVTFNQLPRDQTEVTVTLQYVPPAGKLGQAVAHLFVDPEGRLEEDLRRFKAWAEGARAGVAQGAGVE